MGCVSWLVGIVVAVVVVRAGKDTDEDLAHYVTKEPSTDMPWTSNERRINKMIEDEIRKFNYAPETTEPPFDSQGNPWPTEGREPLWWNAYRQAKDGDRPDWSAEISDLVRNPRTYPPWTPSQESEPVLSKFKNMEPFTWRPGAPVVNLRVRTDATTRLPPGHTMEPTTERSIVLSSAHWDTSEDGGGGGGTDPPLNLASLKKGYKENDDYLKVKGRRRHTNQILEGKKSHRKYMNKVKNVSDLKEKERSQKEIKTKKRRSQQSKQGNMNYARI